MTDECPICLEEINPNMCYNEICLTCSKIFCKTCIEPENHDTLDNCPHCKTSFKLTLDENIDKCCAIVDEV